MLIFEYRSRMSSVCPHCPVCISFLALPVMQCCAVVHSPPIITFFFFCWNSKIRRRLRPRGILVWTFPRKTVPSANLTTAQHHQRLFGRRRSFHIYLLVFSFFLLYIIIMLVSFLHILVVYHLSLYFIISYLIPLHFFHCCIIIAPPAAFMRHGLFRPIRRLLMTLDES